MCFDAGALPDSSLSFRINYLVFRNKKQRRFDLSKGRKDVDKVLLTNELWSSQARYYAHRLREEKYPFYDLNNSPAFVDDF